MIKSGTLALVVGPSGVGKDTLISAARIALAKDANFVFCRRIVTRATYGTSEDHDTLDAVVFTEAERAGRFFLSWHSNGLWTSPDLVESYSLLPASGPVRGFVGCRADVAQSGMTPARVIEPLDVLANRFAGLVAGCE